MTVPREPAASPSGADEPQAGDAGDLTYRRPGPESPLPLAEDRTGWFPVLTFLGAIAFVVFLGGWWYAESRVSRMEQREFVAWAAGDLSPSAPAPAR